MGNDTVPFRGLMKQRFERRPVNILSRKWAVTEGCFARNLFQGKIKKGYKYVRSSSCFFETFNAFILFNSQRNLSGFLIHSLNLTFKGIYYIKIKRLSSMSYSSSAAVLNSRAHDHGNQPPPSLSVVPTTIRSLYTSKLPKFKID